MITATIVFYCIGIFLWLVAGFIMAVEDYDYPKGWKIWRAAAPIILLTTWLWWLIIPAVILWGLFKFSKDAWELFRGRKNADK
jgi:hypothetical protein